MKKIVLSMLAVASMVSANEVITDNKGNFHNVGVLVGYENINADSKLDGYVIGATDRIKMTDCSMSLKGDVYLTYVPSQNEMSRAVFLTGGLSIVSPEINVWNNSVEALAGLELRHEFGEGMELTPKIGLLINKRLEISYKQYVGENHYDALSIGYKF